MSGGSTKLDILGAGMGRAVSELWWEMSPCLLGPGWGGKGALRCTFHTHFSLLATRHHFHLTDENTEAHRREQAGLAAEGGCGRCLTLVSPPKVGCREGLRTVQPGDGPFLETQKGCFPGLVHTMLSQQAKSKCQFSYTAQVPSNKAK